MTRNDNGTVTLSGAERLLGFFAMVVASAVSVGAFVVHTTSRLTAIESNQASQGVTMTRHENTLEKHESRLTTLEAKTAIEE